MGIEGIYLNIIKALYDKLTANSIVENYALRSGVRQGCPLSPSFFFFFSFFLLMAVPVAYGSSQARGQIRVVAEAYSTATATPDLSYIYVLCQSLQPHQIVNPLSQARDQTYPHRDNIRSLTH